ncbi:Hypothetical protein A7982_09811 [Minicystis rosea]|nr:Hypothetical protein A7982_09811 [Minicystis rosea]
MSIRSISRALPFVASLLAGCAPATPASTPSAPAVDPRVAEMAHVHVLMINGGGTPQINYQTHLLHLKAMRETLLGAGIAPDRITILSGDGADPAPDLVTRETTADGDLFYIHGTRQERVLAAPKVTVNSEIPGATLGTAGKADVAAYFEKAKTRLAPGDVLLLYVTDHGTQDTADPLNNTVLLWKREKLTVRDLGALLDGLDPGVRVVGLMSQCYSGAFAALATRASTDGRAHAPFCGYFSVPADRPAYGCYAEDKSRERVGHSFQMIHALGVTRSLSDAHDAVLVRDDAPDSPIRSSDAHLEAVLRREATQRGVPFEQLVDELLKAPQADADATRDRALVDRIGETYGLGSAKTLTDLAARSKELSELEHGFNASVRQWRNAWVDLAGANTRAFLAQSSTWNERLGWSAIKGAEASAQRSLAPSFLADLVTYTPKTQRERLTLYHDRSETTQTAVFRTEVRVSAAIRTRTLLTTIAGRAHLARNAASPDRATYETLRTCEDFRLPGAASTITDPPPAKLVSITEERALETELHPTWIGVNAIDVPPDRRKEQGLLDGAMAVNAVFPDSPALAAGFEVGDIILGTPGHPFALHGDVRAISLLSKTDAPVAIEVLRGKTKKTLSLLAKPAPLELPTKPSSLALGDTAPPLELRTYHGAKVNLADGKPRLLMFWATWCGPCKNALPELLAFEKERKIQVLAITDEETEVVDAFFKKFDKPFPQNVAIDDLQRSIDVFGARARPTFVLLDGKGTMTWRATGYEKGKGLGVEGWKWRGK